MLTVNEYVVVIVGVTTGFCKVEVEPSDPCHNQAVALLELSNKVAEPEMHIGLLLVAPVDEGVGVTVTVVGYTVSGLQPDPAPLLNVNE